MVCLNANGVPGCMCLCCADEKDVKAAMKKQPNKGGVYFPIAAVQVSCATWSR